MNDILDPFSQNSILYAPNPEDDTEDPSFFDTLGASLGYQYDPIVEYIRNQVKFRDEVDPNYFPLQDMEGYEEYESDLLFAQNAEHMVELKGLSMKMSKGVEFLLSQVLVPIFCWSC